MTDRQHTDAALRGLTHGLADYAETAEVSRRGFSFTSLLSEVANPRGDTEKHLSKVRAWKSRHPLSCGFHLPPSPYRHPEGQERPIPFNKKNGFLAGINKDRDRVYKANYGKAAEVCAKHRPESSAEAENALGDLKVEITILRDEYRTNGHEEAADRIYKIIDDIEHRGPVTALENLREVEPEPPEPTPEIIEERRQRLEEYEAERDRKLGIDKPYWYEGEEDAPPPGSDDSDSAGTAHKADNDTPAPEMEEARSLRKDNRNNQSLSKETAKDVPRADPGPFPSCMLNVPGFINEVKAISMERAPFPNETAAFAGALAVLALLTGGKVRTEGDARTNLYVIVLAPSGAGKDYPRKVNAALLREIGMTGALGDSFASSEGLEDALQVNRSMLYQTDEISEYLASVNGDKEGRFRRVQSTLLKLYSSSSSIFPMRRKAGQEGISIDQPHLVLFGTAVPSVFHDAISENMLVNGFFSRCLIMESGPRKRGGEPKAVKIPDSLKKKAEWWREFSPGGDLSMITPQPSVVQTADGNTRKALKDFDNYIDCQYKAAESAGDEVRMAIWSRAIENMHKLSLLYAASENHEQPVITEAAVEGAIDFVLHHARKMLWSARSCVDSQFQKECQRVLEILRRSGGSMLRGQLLKKSKMKAKDFDAIISTLLQTEELNMQDNAAAGGRPGILYSLAEQSH